jgi:hypothetical protein
MEIDFFMHRKWKIPILTLFAIPICAIWGHLKKLFYNSGHDLAYVAWKPWNFVHGRSILRRSFYNICNSPSLLFFSQLSNIKWHNVKASHFFEFSWTSYAGFKMRSKRRAWTFLARGWIFQNYLWIYDKTSTCKPKNDFF